MVDLDSGFLRSMLTEGEGVVCANTLSNTAVSNNRDDFDRCSKRFGQMVINTLRL